MTEPYELKEETERLILVGVQEQAGDDTEDSVYELGELVQTAGAEVVGTMIQRRERIHPGTYIGKGKIEEVRMMADALEAGMYLVVPAETYNADYSYLYQFTPYLTALPGNDYYNSGNDAWDYDPVIGLKAEREEQYGGLTINKKLLGYNNLTQDGTFVFQIEGVKDGVTYSNVAQITMTAAGDASTYVEGIPVGMEVTVTEIYSGGSYEPEGDTVAKATIVADQIVEAGGDGASVSFTNDYNDKLIPGTGVLNQFYAPDEEGADWGFEQNDGSIEAN